MSLKPHFSVFLEIGELQTWKIGCSLYDVNIHFHGRIFFEVNSFHFELKINKKQRMENFNNGPRGGHFDVFDKSYLVAEIRDDVVNG